MSLHPDSSSTAPQHEHAEIARLGTATVCESRGLALAGSFRQIVGDSSVAGPARLVSCPSGDNRAVNAAIELIRPDEVLVIAMPEPSNFGIIGGFPATQMQHRGAVLAARPARAPTGEGFWKLAAENWRAGLHETMASATRRHFVASARVMVPEIKPDDLDVGWSGIRAQAVDRNDAFIDDFIIDSTDRLTLVRNAPSPTATASLAIARHIASQI